MNTGDSICEVPCGGNDPVRGCDGGDGHGMVFEAKCVNESFTSCARHDCANAAIVFEGRPYVPTVGRMKTPGFLMLWFEVDMDFSARGRHGGGVEGK